MIYEKAKKYINPQEYVLDANAQEAADYLPERKEEIRQQAKEYQENGGPKDDRIAFMRSPCYIRYSFAEKVIGKLEELRSWPRQSRMPCVLVAAESGNGKTTIASRFFGRHLMKRRPGEGDACHMPVVKMEAPDGPVRGDFVNELLDVLHARYEHHHQVGRRMAKARTVLKEVGARLLIIDEIQHIIAGSGNMQDRMLNTIKTLSNKLSLPIAAFGTKDSLRAIRKDRQIASRFEQQWAIPKWTMNESYMRLLASIEELLPLQKSSYLADADDQKCAGKILTLSEGTMKEIHKVITKAAKLAITDPGREERITADMIDRDMLDYTPPSEQNGDADDRIDGGSDD